MAKSICGLPSHFGHRRCCHGTKNEKYIYERKRTRSFVKANLCIFASVAPYGKVRWAIYLFPEKIREILLGKNKDIFGTIKIGFAAGNRWSTKT